MGKLSALLVLTLLGAGVYSDPITSYVYSRGDGQRTLHMNGSWTVRDLEKLPPGHYFWFRQGGANYVIRDAATLAAIDDVFALMQKLEPEYEALRRRMRPLEIREREAERRLDRIDDDIDALDDLDRDLSAAEEDRKRELKNQRRPIRNDLREIADALRKLEDEERDLDDRSEKLEEEAERKLVPIVEAALRSGVALRD